MKGSMDGWMSQWVTFLDIPRLFIHSSLRIPLAISKTKLPLPPSPLPFFPSSPAPSSPSRPPSRTALLLCRSCSIKFVEFQPKKQCSLATQGLTFPETCHIPLWFVAAVRTGWVLFVELERFGWEGIESLFVIFTFRFSSRFCFPGRGVGSFGTGTMGVVEEDSPVGYEEIRRKRIEENMKRMKELGLVELSRSLAPVKSCTPTKTVRRKMASSQDLGTEARRSSRVANKPPVDYRDQTDVPGLRARCGTRSDRQGLPRKYMSDKARMAAIDAADEVNKGLVNPAFVKPMLHSHTASGFWLGLPATFCKTHLPLKDDRIMLEDEQEREWETIYLAGKVGLSGGWRGFSLDHDLVDGDCCIFELVSSHRFKVHIFRAHELEFVDDDEEGEGKVQDGDDVKGNKSSNAKKTSAAKAVGSKSAKKSTPKSPKLEDEADGEEATEKPTKLSSSTRPKKKGKAKDATRSLSANRRSRRISGSEDDEDQVDTDEEEDANEQDSDGGAPSTPSQKVKGERKNPLSRKRKSKVITLGSEDSEEDGDDDDDKWDCINSQKHPL